jgi:hypothetical protein
VKVMMVEVILRFAMVQSEMIDDADEDNFEIAYVQMTETIEEGGREMRDFAHGASNNASLGP